MCYNIASGFVYLLLFFLRFFKHFCFSWLCWVLAAEHDVSLVAAASLVAENWLWAPQTWVVVVHGFRCSVACGIFPERGSDRCPLHFKADSWPLDHQWSTASVFMFRIFDHETCRILAPWPGIKPMPLTLKGKSKPLDHQGSLWAFI